MKKRGMGLILPVLGAVTLVGSAFSAWYFDDLTTSKNTGVNLAITDYVQAGTITVTEETRTLTLDQKDTETKLDGTIVFDYKAPTAADGKAPVNTGIKFTLTITIPTKLDTYLTVKTGSIASTGTGFSLGEDTNLAGNIYSYTFTCAEVTNDTKDFTLTLSETVFTWQADGKPTDVDSYKALRTAIEGQTIQIDLTGTIVNPNE